MVSLARAERKAARLVRDVKDIDLDDLYDQLENLRDYVHELSQNVGKSASRQYGRPGLRFGGGARGRGTHEG